VNFKGKNLQNNPKQDGFWNAKKEYMHEINRSSKLTHLKKHQSQKFNKIIYVSSLERSYCNIKRRDFENP
jgi:hypothetical protein